MRLPAGPARFLKTRYIVAALFAAALVLASITGFVWAKKSVTLVVDGTTKGVSTECEDVASLLKEAGVSAGSGDLVSPAPGDSLSEGSVVVVRHAVPVTLRLGDESVSLTVLGHSVADALVMAGLDPTSGMHTDPAVDAPLQPGMTITATDVFLRMVEEQVEVPYDTVVTGDPRLPAGVRKVVTPGSVGSTIRVWQVLMTGEVSGPRSLKLERVLKPAVNEAVSIGTKQRFRQVVTAKRPTSSVKRRAPKRVPAPPLVGRVVKMQATAYTPYACGVGVEWVRKRKAMFHIPDGWGLVAVDRKIYPLGTRMFIPGYGYAVACDTGGAIKGNKLDVLFWGADVNASTRSASAAQKRAARNACSKWGRRYNLRVVVLGK